MVKIILYFFCRSDDENDVRDASDEDSHYDPRKDTDNGNSGDDLTGDDFSGDDEVFESDKAGQTPGDEVLESDEADQTPGENPNRCQTEFNEDSVRPTARCHKRTGKMLTRKRKRDPSSWKGNIRKKLRQSGKEYNDSHGKRQAARSVKTKKDCTKCKFKCSSNLSEADRAAIFEEFWSLDDNEKLHFYGKTTKRAQARKLSTLLSRGKNSFSYHLPCHGVNVRVCKTFYLTTLDISHRRICTYHTSKHVTGGTPTPLCWGQYPKKVVSEEVKNGIRAHIKSVPKIESHYCRAQTNKEYFPQGLSIALLYKKYVEKCTENDSTPAKLHMYRHIFNTEFNIEFHTPKKDRCDACEALKRNEHPTDAQKN